MPSVSISAWLALLVWQTVPAAPPPSVNVEEMAGGGFRLVLNGLEGDERVSQAVIAPIAAQLCGEKTPLFGKFESTRQVTAGRNGEQTPARFVQEIECVVASPTLATPASPTLTPNATREASARKAALSFLVAYDEGNASVSWGMLSQGMQAQQPSAAWATSVAAHVANLGEKSERKIVKLTWYPNPAGVEPGLYVAADFVGSSQTQAYHCGYVALFGKAPDKWSVVRIETGSIPRAMIGAVNADEFTRLKQEIRCVAE